MRINVYRGQHTLEDNKIHTKLPSLSFGSFKSANTYAKNPNNVNDTGGNPKIFEVIIEITKPIINNPNDCFADFDVLISKIGFKNVVEISKRFADKIYATNYWCELGYNTIEELLEHSPSLLETLYVDAYHLLDDEWFINKSKTLGYDGAIHKGNGITNNELEYRIFDKSQIKHLKQVKPTDLNWR